MWWLRDLVVCTATIDVIAMLYPISVFAVWFSAILLCVKLLWLIVYNTEDAVT